MKAHSNIAAVDAFRISIGSVRQSNIWPLPALLMMLVVALCFFSKTLAEGKEADPSGDWAWTMLGRNGGPDRKITLKLRTEGEEVTGKILSPTRDDPNAETEITNGKLAGDEVSFTVIREMRNGKITLKYRGKVSGSSIKGMVEFERDGEPQRRYWEANLEHRGTTTGERRSTPQPLFAGTEVKASGTGFFVSATGYLLSNYHVIKGASAIKVRTSQGLLPATVVRTDPANDIVLLKVSGTFPALPIGNSSDVKQGESVFTVGFPNIELQGTEPKFTKGEISSLSGVQDDPRQFQISVPVQPGNSGGPLLNASGNVVGIVTARLSDGFALRTSGALPQNVNYATKSAYVLPVLESVSALAGQLKPRHSAPTDKFADAVQEAHDAAALVLVY